MLLLLNSIQGGKFMMSNKNKLIDKILNEQNIFSAIFSMESYVFDIGLLETEMPVFLINEEGVDGDIIANNDLELYYALADKHNVELIEKVIDTCQRRMKWLFEDKENLFEARVYFKFKNYDEGRLKFRPMHTARLIDLICMVSILNCLMFDDDFEKGERKLSDLSKLLPHNFYGNIPCTDVQFLFHKWQTKYKEYTEEVIGHCRTYQQNHSYLTEVCLDIKNFFPSISPKMLFDYIISKLSKTYEGDIDDLSKAVAKLLYFRINKDNIEPWLDYYYPEDANLTGVNFYVNCGIPQGLPQSYFLGNLCMIEVKRLLMRDTFFKGDAYFYVDDSVIYIQAKLDDATFRMKINGLNTQLNKWCYEAEKETSSLSKYIGNDCLAFQKKLSYKIQFHEKGKSVFTHIDDADNRYGPIANITREASLHSKLAYNLDEVDDHVSLKKLKALDEVLTKEIHNLTQRQKTETGDSTNGDALASRLKLLRRFKKFFLYRNRLLKIREEGGPSDEMLDDFRTRFIAKASNVAEFFEQYDEDIFQSEYRLLIQKLPKKEAYSIVKEIEAFEKQMLESCELDTKYRSLYLFHTKDVKAAFKMKALTRDIYASLTRWSKENFSGLKSLDFDKQMTKFRAFLEPVKNSEVSNMHNIFDMQRDGYDGKRFTLFVIKTSAEYQRRILNVYFSEIMDVVPSDALAFTKMNARRLRYSELRILAYLRNPKFDLEDFEEFVEHLAEKDISNQMGIDMGVLEVLNIFIRRVRRPEWVDSLIVTHRLTKGLWYNGSKFLNSYTLHNEEHAVTLITKSMELTNRIDYFVLKDIDFYILFLSCYLHDISMVIHPDMGRLSSENGNNLVLISDIMAQMQIELEKYWDVGYNDKKNSRYKNAGKFLIDVFNKVYGYFETLVRDNHAKDSAKFIRDRSNSLLKYLEPTLLSFVAKVSESHGYDVLDVYGLKSRAKDDTISLKYLMILIRMADLLDVANDRVNYHLLRQNLKNMSLTSKFHWISHLVTDKIELDTDYDPDKDAEIGEKPIREIINLKLFLNFKQLTVAGNNMKCQGCQMEMGNDSLIIKIKGGDDRTRICEEEQCMVLCCWMMKKHEWLVKELSALNDYLFTVNNSLFKTEINFIICYRDEMKLDADMFDSVQEYLKTS